MLQFYLDVLYKGSVYPLLSGGAAGLSDDGAKIALGEAHATCIEIDLVLVCGMLVDKEDKSVKDGLFATLRCLH